MKCPALTLLRMQSCRCVRLRERKEFQCLFVMIFRLWRAAAPMSSDRTRWVTSARRRQLRLGQSIVANGTICRGARWQTWCGRQVFFLCGKWHQSICIWFCNTVHLGIREALAQYYCLLLGKLVYELFSYVWVIIVVSFFELWGLLLQVELRGNRVCPVKPKMVLTSTVAIPAHTWVQLPWCTASWCSLTVGHSWAVFCSRFRCPSRNAGLLEQFCRGRLVAKICLKKLKTPNDQFLIFQLQDGLDQVVKLWVAKTTESASLNDSLSQKAVPRFYKTSAGSSMTGGTCKIEKNGVDFWPMVVLIWECAGWYPSCGISYNI